MTSYHANQLTCYPANQLTCYPADQQKVPIFNIVDKILHLRPKRRRFLSKFAI